MISAVGGKGFVVAISRRWPEPEQAYRAWHRERAKNDFSVGQVRFVRVKPDTWIANMIGQHGMKTGSHVPPVRYEAIQKALAQVSAKAAELNATVHMPRIGCGLAAGTWNRIEPLVLEALAERTLPPTV